MVGTQATEDADRELLAELAAVSDPDERARRVFEKPRLLTPGVIERVADELSAESSDTAPAFAGALHFVYSLRAAVEEDPTAYPLGLGPFEGLWERVASGEISKTYATAVVRDERLARMLSPPYTERLCRLTTETAREGRWRDAVDLHRLLVAAIESSSDGDVLHGVRDRIASDWMLVVLLALMKTSDPHLLESARAVGDQLVERARAAGNVEVAADSLYRLGILHLDPYTARPQLAVDRRDDAGEGMPAPAQALRTAEMYLREAVAMASGRLRGMALEALAIALSDLKARGEPVDRKEIVRVAQSALPLLDHPEDAPYVLAVHTVLRDHGESVDSASLANLSETAMERFGRWGASDIARMRTRLYSRHDQEEAAEAARLARSLANKGDEDSRVETLLAEAKLVAQIVGVREPRGPAGWRRSAALRLEQRARRAGWDELKTSRGLFGLAFRSVGGSAAAGLVAIGALRQRHATFVEENRDLVDFLEATLRFEAADAARSRASADALANYVDAIGLYSAVDLDRLAMSVLPSFAAMATAEPRLLTPALFERLAPYVLRLQQVVGTDAIEVTRILCRNVIAVLEQAPASSELAVIVAQLAKGLRFGASLQRDVPYDPAADPSAAELLAAIERSRLEAGVDAVADGESYNEEGLLSAWIAPTASAAGATPLERLANLEGAFDEHVAKRLLERTHSRAPLLLRLEDIQAAIDARTVILDVYLGRTINGLPAAYVLILTKDEARLTAQVRKEAFGPGVFIGPSEHELMETWVQFAIQGVTTSSFAPLVAKQRMLLQEEPFGRPVTAQASEALGRTFDAILGSAAADLSRYAKEGKDHLCVIPHGPVHYLPIHLLGSDGHCLADDWTVTYLPNLRLLARRPESRTIGLDGGRAVGIGFGDQEEQALEPLLRAVPEACAVASLFGTEPLLDEDATRDAVLAALRMSRYVHVATHGRHSPRSPAFQSLFVATEGNGSSELHAYELLGLDLSGLELVTLSACETALGRFDVGDNLRGLTACLLHAGVQTIVGTLWPAADEPCEAFFTAFHREYGERPSALDAFALAQRAVRSEHPEYRDWGAFYLIGEFRPR